MSLKEGINHQIQGGSKKKISSLMPPDTHLGSICQKTIQKKIGSQKIYGRVWSAKCTKKQLWVLIQIPDSATPLGFEPFYLFGGWEMRSVWCGWKMQNPLMNTIRNESILHRSALSSFPSQQVTRSYVVQEAEHTSQGTTCSDKTKDLDGGCVLNHSIQACPYGRLYPSKQLSPTSQ